MNRLLVRPLPRALVALRPDPWRCALAVAAGAGALAAAIALLGVSGWLITRASQQPPVLYLMTAVVAVRALGLGRGVLRYAERLVGHDVALRGAVTLRTTLYERLSVAPSGVAAGYRRGDLLARLGTDVDTVADLVVRAVLPCAVALLAAAGAVTAVALILPAAGAALAAGLVVAGVAAPLLTARAAGGAERDAAAARAAVSAEVVDLLDALPELTVAGAVPARLRRQAALEERLATELDGAARPAALGAALSVLGTGGALLGCLALGASAAGSGRLDPVLLAVIVLVALGAAETVAALPAAATALVRGRHAAERICELTDAAAPPVVSALGTSPAPCPRAAPADLSPAPSATLSPGARPGLRAEALACGFSAGAPVVHGLDLDLPPGSRVAVVGASGSGKTTLLLTLAGLLPPAGGRLRLSSAGTSRPAGQDDLRAAVVFIADDAHVFSTTVRENLRLAAPSAGDAALLAALERVGLRPWLGRHTAGLDTLVGDGVAGGAAGADGVLSGGERRRLLLARAVLSRAGILLLDEPAEHLDPATADTLVASALTRGRGGIAGDRTVVVVTHRLAPLGLADEVLVLDDGRVAARGTHEALLAQHEPYRRAYEHESLAALGR